MSIESLLGQVAKGLPIALGLLLILYAGQKRMWVWAREIDALNEAWAKRFEEFNARHVESLRVADIRLQESKDTCTEWKEIAKKSLGAAEKIVPVIAETHK